MHVLISALNNKYVRVQINCKRFKYVTLWVCVYVRLHALSCLRKSSISVCIVYGWYFPGRMCQLIRLTRCKHMQQLISKLLIYVLCVCVCVCERLGAHYQYATPTRCQCFAVSIYISCGYYRAIIMYAINFMRYMWLFSVY